MRAPADSASSRRVGPSITKARSFPRSFGSRTSRRKRWTCAARNDSGSGRLFCPSSILGHPYQGGEGGGIGDGEVGEHLTVHLHAGEPKPVDEAVVAHALGTCRGVDALDPQLAEVALARPSVAVGVLQRVHDLLVGRAERPALIAVVALRSLEHGMAVLLAVDGPLDPGHRTPFACRSVVEPALPTEEPLDAGPVAPDDLDLAGEAAGAGARLGFEVVPAERLVAQDLFGARHLEAFLGAGVRLHLRHLSSPVLPVVKSGPARRPPRLPPLMLPPSTSGRPQPAPACRVPRPSSCCARRDADGLRSWPSAPTARQSDPGCACPTRGGRPLGL